MEVKRPKIIYIAGSGRSGSTITDILLSQGESITGVGELARVFTLAWTNNEYCACGQKALDCPFWSKVKKRWERESYFTIPEYIKIQREYLTLYSIPRIVYQALSPTQKFKRFSHDTKLLYRIIGKMSESRVVIDSSKAPVWMAAMRVMGIDLNILHLVRDGRDVLKSNRKHLKADPEGGVPRELPPKPVLSVGLRWLVINLMVEILANKKKYLRVKYEGLSINPINILQTIENEFNIDLKGAKSKMKHQALLKKPHTIAGGRVRMKDRLHFMADNSKAKKEEQPPKNPFVKRIFMIIIFPILKRYGY